MISHDAFLSYSSEDTELASELFKALAARGFRIWYAPVGLKIGDKLLDSIEKGMRESKYGILLLSRSYLAKGWTNYEMDILIRESVEHGRKLLPIWHGVSKQEVSIRHSGLAGIVAIDSAEGIGSIVPKLTKVLSDNAQTIAVIPSYESPKWRFLQGRGEININSEGGPASNLWEFLIYSEDANYPLFIEGESFTKDDLLLHAAQLLPHVQDELSHTLAKHRKDLYELCRSAGIDPDVFA